MRARGTRDRSRIALRGTRRGSAVVDLECDRAPARESAQAGSADRGRRLSRGDEVHAVVLPAVAPRCHAVEFRETRGRCDRCVREEGDEDDFAIRRAGRGQVRGRGAEDQRRAARGRGLRDRRRRVVAEELDDLHDRSGWRCRRP